MEHMLRTETLCLTPEQSRQTIYYPFQVPEGMTELRVHFRFAPGEESAEEIVRPVLINALKRDAPWMDPDAWRDYLPVKNLINLSIDAPNGTRGCAHRHAPDAIYALGVEMASPGFYPGEIIAGEWRVGVHIHSITSPEVEACLEIVGVSE